MLRSRFGNLGVAGFAAVAGVVLVVSSAGAHQTHMSSRGGLMPLTGVATSTEQGGADVDADAAAEAAELTADVQQQEAAEQATEAQGEAADTDGDTDETETETPDTETETPETETETPETESETQPATTHETETESGSGD